MRIWVGLVVEDFPVSSSSQGFDFHHLRKEQFTSSLCGILHPYPGFRVRVDHKKKKDNDTYIEIFPKPQAQQDSYGMRFFRGTQRNAKALIMSATAKRSNQVR